MFKNFVKNLGKPFCRWCNRFYLNAADNNANDSEKFQLIETLKKKDISCSSVSDTKCSEILNMDFEECESRIMLLKKYGFNDINCMKIIKSYPTVLKIPEETLINIIEQWNLCNLEQNNIQLILIQQPHFLDLPDSEIRKRIAYLHSICKSKASITTLIIENPNIMTDDWKDILVKIDYLQKTKRIPQGEIIHSKALSKSLDFIKLRLDILEKCGIFKVIKVMPHKSKTIKHKNPHLMEIIDLDDVNFSKFIAHISEEEYIMYSDLYFNMDSDSEELNDFDSNE